MLKRHRRNMVKKNRPGFNPIKNIFSSENLSVKKSSILKTHIFSVKTEKKYVLIFWCRFMRIIYRKVLIGAQHEKSTGIF